jgi:hypothetical protein
MRGIKVLVVGLAAATLVSVSAVSVSAQAAWCPGFNENNAVNLGAPPLVDVYLVDINPSLNDLMGAIIAFGLGVVRNRVATVQAIINNVVAEANRRPAGAVDVLIGAQGGPGFFTLSQDGLVGNNNTNEQTLINGLRGKIKSLWIISCSVAQGNEGGAFLQRLAQGLAVGAKQVVAVSGPTGDLAVKNNNLFCSPKTCNYAMKGANPIPSLTEWGLIALAVLLAGGMGYMIYRRRPALRPAAP